MKVASVDERRSCGHCSDLIFRFLSRFVFGYTGTIEDISEIAGAEVCLACANGSMNDGQ